MSVEVYLALQFTAGVVALVSIGALAYVVLMAVIQLGMRAARRWKVTTE